MSTPNQPRPGGQEAADADAERDVDLHRHWNALALRWWLPAAGLVGGIVIGLLASLGGSQVYTAKTTLYLGQPLSPVGSVQIQSQATNPSTVKQIIHSQAVLRLAAREAGMQVGKLGGHVSSKAVAGSLTKLGQTPLVQLAVTGDSPRKIQIATNSLAQSVLNHTNGYAVLKIAALKAQIASYEETLGTIDKTTSQLQSAASSSGLSTSERLLVAIQLNAQALQRSQAVDSLAQARQLLSMAQGVELGRVEGRAIPVKTTARSRRNTVVVAGLIGLLLGIFAALLWEPAARVVRRTA